VLLTGLDPQIKTGGAHPLGNWRPRPVGFKRNIVMSLCLGIAGGLAAYTLAWGLFVTHPELGMESASAGSVAAWTAPLVFVGSLLYFAVRQSGRR
jgi:hypothetical protein